MTSATVVVIDSSPTSAVLPTFVTGYLEVPLVYRYSSGSYTPVTVVAIDSPPIGAVLPDFITGYIDVPIVVFQIVSPFIESYLLEAYSPDIHRYVYWVSNSFTNQPAAVAPLCNTNNLTDYAIVRILSSNVSPKFLFKDISSGVYRVGEVQVSGEELVSRLSYL